MPPRPTSSRSSTTHTMPSAAASPMPRASSAFGDLSGSVDAYTYNARSELTSARRTKNGQSIPGFSEDFDYDPIGNRRSSATYNEKGEAQTSTYEANNLNQYTSRTTPGYAAVRGEADPNAFVSINGNEAYRLGSYYFGSDLFDNSTAGGLANLESYATLAQAAANGEEAEDLVSATTNQVYLAQSPETFEYDDDGNQTLITTKTGLWRVTYNGENRPILWVRDSDNTTLTMSYDHMGRRREKKDQRFFYDGYLQIASIEHLNNRTAEHFFLWDPTGPVATRPLVWNGNGTLSCYVFDGNKNVSEVVASNNDVAAHYEYAPFGALTVQHGTSAMANPWRFSSEYAEDDTATVYYNYRHYEPVTGRWVGRDLIWERGGRSLYAYCINRPSRMCDRLGLYSSVGIETHQNILKHALNALLDEGVAPCLKNNAALKEYVLNALQQANVGMDKGKYAKDDYLYFHFNRKMDVESNYEIEKVITKYKDELKKRRKAAGDDIKNGFCENALVQLGELTHMTQDYWGHGVSYEYKGKTETLYYWEHGEKYPIGEVTVYPSDDVIGEATGDPDNPMMKPSNYNGPFGGSEHGATFFSREPGNRAPDGTGWAVPEKWNYNEGRLGKAVDYTKQDLRTSLGDWCKKCCNLLNRSYSGPSPTMPEVIGALNNLNW